MSKKSTPADVHQTDRKTAVDVRPRPVDTLQAIGEQHRLRSYRDPCGDWNIPGRLGEVFWCGSARDGLLDRIGVQIGGPRANDSPTRTTEKGGNLRINRLLQIWEKLSQRGDGEAVFLLPAGRILEAASSIGAKRRRSLSPEQRTAAIHRLERFRQARGGPNSSPGTHVAGQERG
ncbi:MAG TPA: hypothetical protein VLG48_03465 [Candidatus Methylomirabilis sp.]|nr:hypothetical protein [Candidatus Methylomirabilis sp.]